MELRKFFFRKQHRVEVEHLEGLMSPCTSTVVETANLVGLTGYDTVTSWGITWVHMGFIGDAGPRPLVTTPLTTIFRFCRRLWVCTYAFNTCRYSAW